MVHFRNAGVLPAVFGPAALCSTLEHTLWEVARVQLSPRRARCPNGLRWLQALRGIQDECRDNISGSQKVDQKSRMQLDRRKFLKTIAAAGAAGALPPFRTEPPPSPGSLDLVFFTDTHIQPELDAAHGCDMCFRKIATLNPEFAIMGGDHVFDAFEVNRVRAGMVYDLYKHTEQQLGMPLHHAIGNHDVFGVFAKSGVTPSDPAYGKKMYQDRMGQTYYSFDYKGYHFVVLDSIQPTADRQWEARVDEGQLRWLRDDLKALQHGTPVIAVCHCPL